MTLEDEEKFIGEEMHLVPKIDPGEKCNARTSTYISHEDRGNIKVFDGYCKNKAGTGTDHLGEGRCKHHGGSTPKGKGGAAKHNQNAATNHLRSDPHHYAENLDPAEEDWVRSTTAAILDRVRKIQGREPDFLDRVLAKRIAINFHILGKATQYTQDEIVQVILHEDGSSHEEPGALVEEVRRYSNSIFRNLRDMGVLEFEADESESEASQWKTFIKGEN